jgi:hypothetical protein
VSITRKLCAGGAVQTTDSLGVYAAYRRAWHRQRTPAGQHMRRVRQRTVEPVFSHLLYQYGLRRVGTKGRAAAHKTMLLSAIAYNLKKLLRHQPNQSASGAIALWPPRQGPCPTCFSTRVNRYKLLKFILLTK